MRHALRRNKIVINDDLDINVRLSRFYRVCFNDVSVCIESAISASVFKKKSAFTDNFEFDFILSETYIDTCNVYLDVIHNYVFAGKSLQQFALLWKMRMERAN